MPRRALATSVLLAAALLTGCKPANQAAQGTNAPTAPQALTTDASAVDLYNARRYADAKTKADAAIATSKGHDREVNQLTAGLSAYALKQNGLAEHYLSPLLPSSDPQIAGRAEAVLGQIAEKKGNHQYAADLFKRASAHLEGDDAARAAVRAGNSLSEIGRPAEAAQQYKVAAKEADSLAIKQTATKLGQPGPFTVQVGAYTTKAAADKRAREMTATAVRAGYGAPRVVADTINGKPGYSVQVGTFAARQAANLAKTRLGSGYIVVAVN
jgi:tetratricopeptide (TPR) repeat protein